ncbi:MAG: hypothetical protein ABF451_09015, partial [Bifidobacterium aquikefiri]|uniref:hypothetical protein n=1 Tax=Bifidobacterium aquikefiri TaxID=1653207 RepID=UPI0039EB2E1C
MVGTTKGTSAITGSPKGVLFLSLRPLVGAFLSVTPSNQAHISHRHIKHPSAHFSFSVTPSVQAYFFTVISSEGEAE